MSPWDLRRAVPVTQRVGEFVTVVSVELYGNGICVRWLDDHTPHHGRERFDNRPRLSDDRGTRYTEHGYTVGTWLSGLHGEIWFTPALSAEARRLTIAADDAVLDVEV